MQWREFITLLGGAAVGWPLVARAQRPDRMRRISMLTGIDADDSGEQARYAAFVEGLQQLDWTDGRNLRIDTRSAASDADRIRKYAAEVAPFARISEVKFGGTSNNRAPPA